jgi:hypothetical protein
MVKTIENFNPEDSSDDNSTISSVYRPNRETEKEDSDEDEPILGLSDNYFDCAIPGCHIEALGPCDECTSSLCILSDSAFCSTHTSHTSHGCMDAIAKYLQSEQGLTLSQGEEKVYKLAFMKRLAVLDAKSTKKLGSGLPTKLICPPAEIIELDQQSDLEAESERMTIDDDDVMELGEEKAKIISKVSSFITVLSREKHLKRVFTFDVQFFDNVTRNFELKQFVEENHAVKDKQPSLYNAMPRELYRYPPIHNWYPAGAYIRQTNSGPRYFFSHCAAWHPKYGYRYIVVQVNYSTCDNPIHSLTLKDTDCDDVYEGYGIYLFGQPGIDGSPSSKTSYFEIFIIIVMII